MRSPSRASRAPAPARPVADQGMYAVGTNNNTDFLRPVTVAEVEVLAEAIFQGPHPAALGGLDHAA